MSKYSDKTTSVDIMNEFGENVRGKYVIVTGGNCGLGLESCRALSEYGAHVVIACRNPKLGEEAVQEIKSKHPNAQVSTMVLDLASFASIDSFVENYKLLNRPLHILLNNAGVMACPLAFTKDGHEMQFGVNHLGHFRLTMKLIDLLQSSATKAHPSRIINVASLAQYLFAPHDHPIPFDDLKGEQSYNAFVRYGSSKIANVYFTKKLSEKYSTDPKHPVLSITLHPGSILGTNLARHLGIGIILGGLRGAWQNGALWAAITEKLKTIPEGTATQLLACAAPETEITSGEYYADCQIEKEQVHPKLNDKENIDELWRRSFELNEMKEE